MENQYYNNQHCHTHETNPTMTDCIVKTEDYIKRAKELGHKNIFTTEHGGSRDIYPVYELCKKHGLNMIFGAEAYYVDDINYTRSKDIKYVNDLFMKCYNVWSNKHNINLDFDVDELNLFSEKKKRDKSFSAVFKDFKEQREELESLFYSALEKVKKMDRKNYHLIIIAMTENAMEEINVILSKANIEGMYNKRPRVDLSMMLSLPKDEVIVTTACVGGRLFTDNYEEKFLNPMMNHFGDNFMLEVQDHNTPMQIEWNKKILELKDKYGLKIIHGCDSHYIYPEQAKDRDDFIKGKGVWYSDEENFVMDYPEKSEIIQRYRNQGVLSEDLALEALNNTLIFDNAEPIILNDDVKMPTIYPELTPSERFSKLYDIVKENLSEKLKEVPREKWREYVDATKFEMDIIKETSIPEVRTCDYFLINHQIIDKGVNKYGGVLTKTGRGSAVSFLVNHLLKFTEIDRLDAEVPLYPTRFMSTSRILESRSMPDIDYNVEDTEPFLLASKEVLGDDHCYMMVAYGTLQSSGAFKVMAKRMGYEEDQIKEFGKKLAEIEKIKDKKKHDEEYNKMLQDKKFGDILKESEKFIGVIDSISPSPCSSLLWDESITRKLGLRRVGDENKKSVICCNIDGYTADTWKFLKNDFLVVTVWALIAETYRKINKPIPSIKELRGLLDDSIWDLYSDGITKTLNQVDSDFATPLVMRYSPKTPAELTAFVAGIRPSFKSLLDGFLDRVEYSTGTPELDKLLEASFSYMLYQESLMMYLSWLGVEESGTYDIIKKISKKKFSDQELESLKKMLNSEWIKIIGNDEGFESTWTVMHDASKYAFNSSHALSVAWDSLYGAELKAHYPLEYYTVVFNNEKYNDAKKVARIVPELSYFNISLNPIKFRYSQSGYSMDKSTNSIYKGMYSIKYINEKISEELYSLKDNKYNSFLELLIDIKDKTSTDARQLMILTKLDFFSEFGKSKKLLQIIDLYDTIYNKKQFKKDELSKLGISEYLIKKFSQKETEKLYKEVDTFDLVNYLINQIEDKEISIKERYEHEKEYLGYLEHTYNDSSEELYYVTNFKTYGDKTSTPYLSLYQIATGKTIRAQITKSKLFSKSPFKEGAILQIYDMKQELKKKKVSCELYENKYGKMVDYKYITLDGEYKNVIENYEAY